MRQNPPNARFWIRYNCDWVKLTIQPGKSVQFGFSRPTEEGYHSESWRFDHDYNDVTRSIESNSSDCDGPLDTFTKYRAKIDELADDMSMSGVRFPLWEKVNASQRDHFAERMGY